MKCSYVVVGVWIISLIGFFSIIVKDIYAQNNVIISPTCGPAEGFNIILNTNGFLADSNVSWEMVDKNGNPVLAGYFLTNSSGGFNEITFVDDMLPGNYILNIFDDNNLDSKLDFNGEISQSNISLPCS
ncbi:MAG: hypothetical protein ACE5SW_10065 [Nitrososphaeraceae archaeon]